MDPNKNDSTGDVNEPPEFHKQVTSLESAVGVNNVDKVMQAALNVWDTFVSRYPDSLFNKTMLHNNFGLLRRLVDVVVPGTLSRIASLEHDLEDLESNCVAVQYKVLADLLSLTGLIPITVSLVETHAQLSRALDKMSSYPFLGIYNDRVGVEDGVCVQVIVENQKLLNPLWLVCITLPNESLSPHLVEHSVYSRMVPDSKGIVHVDFEASPLMLESEAVSKLLDELDYGTDGKALG